MNLNNYKLYRSTGYGYGIGQGRSHIVSIGIETNGEAYSCDPEFIQPCELKATVKRMMLMIEDKIVQDEAQKRSTQGMRDVIENGLTRPSMDRTLMDVGAVSADRQSFTWSTTPTQVHINTAGWAISNIETP